MPKNEAVWDRVVRVVVGLMLLLLTVAGPRTLWGLVGVVPLLTAFFGYCPLYSVFRLSTLKSR